MPAVDIVVEVIGGLVSARRSLDSDGGSPLGKFRGPPPKQGGDRPPRAKEIAAARQRARGCPMLFDRGWRWVGWHRRSEPLKQSLGGTGCVPVDAHHQRNHQLSSSVRMESEGAYATGAGRCAQALGMPKPTLPPMWRGAMRADKIAILASLGLTAVLLESRRHPTVRLGRGPGDSRCRYRPPARYSA